MFSERSTAISRRILEKFSDARIRPSTAITKIFSRNRVTYCRIPRSSGSFMSWLNYASRLRFHDSSFTRKISIRGEAPPRAGHQAVQALEGQFRGAFDNQVGHRKLLPLAELIRDRHEAFARS